MTTTELTDLILEFLIDEKGSFRYHHYALIFTGKKPGRINVLSRGINSDRIIKCGSLEIPEHAEMCAARKLKPNLTGGRPVKVNIFIIRINKTEKIGQSNPCGLCLNYLDYKLDQKNYTINTVYYSNSDGYFESKAFSDLLNEKDKHFSRYFKLNMDIMNNKNNKNEFLK
jgi:hypothetical protein